MTVSGDDLGFYFSIRKNGTVEITHKGRKAVVLRGRAAREFVAETESASRLDMQAAMARVTGNYKHGNERMAANHLRNRR